LPEQGLNLRIAVTARDPIATVNTIVIGTIRFTIFNFLSQRTPAIQRLAHATNGKGRSPASPLEALVGLRRG
jgi:hypothetical protein